MPARFADAVIVAAGSSRRMAGADKLDAALLGRPLLEWSVEAMARAASVDRIILVTRPGQVDSLASATWLADVAGGRAVVVAGGPERSDSVRAGVAASNATVVLVHDAARPLATPALADAVATAAAEHGAAVPVVPVVDSLKRAAGDVLAGSIDRSGLVRTQTPQGVRRELLLACFSAAGAASFSDEAALLESQGVSVAMVPGEPANMKVTEPADLELIRAIASGRQQAADGTDGPRIGFGQDSHGFGPDDGLWLGGVLIDRAPRLYGHSDGDVVLHALATAILAACGLGDLGRMFPASEPGSEGVASAVLLGAVVARAASAGWRVTRAQVAILGARPHLGGQRLDEMRLRIAELLGLPAEQVAATASSGNLSGPEGAGRVISATAVIGVHRR